MRGEANRDLAVEDSGRERRIRLVLLVLTLALVALYAGMMAGFGDHIQTLLARASLAEMPVQSLGAAVLAALAAAAVLVRLRRRRAASSQSRSAARNTVASLSRRDDLLGYLDKAIAAHVQAGRQLSVHQIDIDRFSALNAALGEAAGDALLNDVAGRLLGLVDDPARVARIGDDEFVVVQTETGGGRHAEIFGKRILDTLHEACAEIPIHARPGVSIGIAVGPNSAENAVQLLHNAGLALKAAKRAGGDTFQLFTRDLAIELEARLKMEKAIGDGLALGLFELHFQPQYDLSSRRLTGFEALLRMNHPDLGQLQPASFLPIAEASGLIQPLGEWVVREALMTAGQWPEHLTLSLNLSAGQFRGGDIAGTIARGLAAAGVSGSRLRIEISETVFANGSEAVVEQLERIRATGAQVVLDDFGLNASNLQALAGKTCDAVKLDRSFVQRIGEEPATEKLVRGLIGTAQSFNLPVLAEGIERAEQAHFLMSNDCQRVQGYLFGRPAHPTEVAAIIAKDMRKMAPSEPASEPGKSSSAA